MLCCVLVCSPSVKPWWCHGECGVHASLATPAKPAAASGASAAGGSPSNVAHTLNIVKAQIVFLLSTLTEDSYAKNEREINSLLQTHGADAHIHLIRRLVPAAAPALNSHAIQPQSPSTPHAPLALRLLVSEVRKLARDPLITPRLREAVVGGLYDPAQVQQALEAFRTLDLRLLICEKAQLTPLESLILCQEITQLLVTPIPTSFAKAPPRPPGLAKDMGLVAATMLRECWSNALESLGTPSAELVAHEVFNDLGPIQVSRLLENLLSDLYLDFNTGEAKTCAFDGGEALLTEQRQRDLVRAVANRFSSVELASQIASHSIESLQIAPGCSVTRIIHRLCPDQSFCTVDLVRAVFSRWSNLSSSSDDMTNAVSYQFLALIREATDYGESFGLDTLAWLQAVNSLVPEVQWGRVIRVFDSADQAPPVIWGMRIVAAILAAEGPEVVKSLWRPQWRHPERQLLLIERLLLLPSDLLAAALRPSDDRRALSTENFNDAPLSVRQLALSVFGSVWNNVDLVQTLIQLSAAGKSIHAGEMALRVRDVFERGIKTDASLILISLVILPKPWNSLHTELCARLLSAFLHGQSGYQIVFYRIRQIDNNLLTAALRDHAMENELNVSRVVDVAQELNILDCILAIKPTIMALDVSAVAGRREILQLDIWLSAMIQAQGPPFVRSILEFLSTKIRYEAERAEKQDQSGANVILLPGNIIATFLKAARMHSDTFTLDDAELFKEVRQAALQLHPRLMNFAPGSDREPGTHYQTFVQDIEAEGDVLFRQLYDGDASVEDVINLLQRARESADPRSIQFFAYVLSALYEEKRFFSTYPEKELDLTAHLFGTLIHNRMIEHIPLGIAVRYVLDALKSPLESSWFRFGVQALSRFHTRLAEWPQFAQAIADIPHLQHTSPEVHGWATMAIQSPAEAEEGQNLLVSDGILGRQIFTALTPDVPERNNSIEDPDEVTADRIGFIFNNLSAQNLEKKSQELRQLLRPELIAWTARYMVEDRVSIEPNNHRLYTDLLDELDMPALTRRILYETYVKSAAMLNAETTAVNSTERSVLKTLGMWLGSMTLARNKPIMQRNVAFKELLFEGYDSGRLIVAIPFACKVLEQAAHSRVFKAPNPWLMGILKLLVELYHYAEIKLNLKFEIEVLCKSLKIDLKCLPPSMMIRDRTTKQELATAQSAAQTAQLQQVNQNMNVRTSLESVGVFGAPSSTEKHGIGTQHPAPGQQPDFSSSLQDIVSQALQALPGAVAFNPDVFPQGPSGQHQALRRAVHVGIDRAVREIIAPVVERSVTIAGIATRELATKDFAMEGDEDRLGKAAHLMVQNLAANLANVTCKDPLRISMLSNIRAMLVGSGLAELLSETHLNHLVQDNLDFACLVVENVAKEKALLEIDDALTSHYIARRKHRDRSNQPFWDTAAMAATHHSNFMPDSLRIKLGGLQINQLRVYEDFGRVRTGLPLSEDDPTFALAQRISQPQSGHLLSPTHDSRMPQALQVCIGQVNAAIGELEGILSQTSPDLVSLSQLPSRHIIFTCIESICNDTHSSVSPEDSMRATSSKIVQMIYRAETPLARETYVVILERLCLLSNNVLREVSGWFTYAEDERKLSVAVLVAVASRSLLDVGRFDGVLAALIARDWRPKIIDFAAQFVALCLVSTPPVASREQLVQTLDAMVQAAENGKATDLALELLDDLRGTAIPSAKEMLPEQAALRERLTAYFVDWVKLFQQSSNVDKAFVDFVTQLQSDGVLRGEEISSMFFRICTEVSIEAYIKNKAAGAIAADLVFVPIDSLARLIVLLVKYHADPDVTQSDAAKVLYMNKILSIVVLVLAHNHEEFGAHFQQKPFFRLLSSMLSNLHAIESYIGTGCYQLILQTLSSQIQTLQPVYFPGFAFSWLSLISHRLYMPRLLDNKWSDGNRLFSKHLLSMLRFLSPFFRSDGLRNTIRALYFGFLRVVLVLLHDFPDFLAMDALTLVQATPVSCVQLTNVFTSAFPASARLPDPFGDGIDNLQEMSRSPAFLTSIDVSMPAELRAALERATSKGAQTSAFHAVARRYLLVESSTGEYRYNYWLFGVLMQHLCSVAVTSSQTAFAVSDFAVTVIEQLLHDFDVEGRYLIIAAAASLLRWPSTHTRWAKHLLFHLYSSATCSELVTRVLLERLLVSRPHPWGIVWAMSSLIRQNLVEASFVQKHPEMAALVAKMENSLR